MVPPCLRSAWQRSFAASCQHSQPPAPTEPVPEQHSASRAVSPQRRLRGEATRPGLGLWPPTQLSRAGHLKGFLSAAAAQRLWAAKGHQVGPRGAEQNAWEAAAAGDPRLTPKSEQPGSQGAGCERGWGAGLKGAGGSGAGSPSSVTSRLPWPRPRGAAGGHTG